MDQDDYDKYEVAEKQSYVLALQRLIACAQVDDALTKRALAAAIGLFSRDIDRLGSSQIEDMQVTGFGEKLGGGYAHGGEIKRGGMYLIGEVPNYLTMRNAVDKAHLE